VTLDAPSRTLRALAAAFVALAVIGCASPLDSFGPTASAPATNAPARASPPSPGGPLASRDPSASPSLDPTTRPATIPPTVAEVARLQAVVGADPADADARRDLGFALAQRVRETADPSLYAAALDAFEAALRLRPDDALALVGIAGVQLARHEFAAALETAHDALVLSPSLVAAHAAKVDALVELGRYDEADAAAGVMLGLSADLATLARVSYLAELRGRLPAALAAMRQAAASPGLALENTAYVQALLGNLLVSSGDLAAAGAAYRAALDLVPDHPPSLAGQGRLAVGAGRLDEAIALFERAASILPLPEYVIALGDAQAAAGRASDATRSYDLARAEIQLFKAAGVVVDVDLALLEADHGDPATALVDAMAAHAATPTVRAADAMAWALHRLGRDAEAMPFVTEALRLGSIDPILRYHAGAIEAALGRTADARRDLELALATDPGFSATAAADARRLLATLAA
jgi:tetratricopeptide (TPR) repeat protein